MKHQVSRQHPCYMTIMVAQFMILFIICNMALATDYLVLDAIGLEYVVPRTTVISGMLDIPSGTVVELLGDRGERIRVVGPYKGDISRIGQAVSSSPRFRLNDIARTLRIFLSGTSSLSLVRAENEGITADPRMLVPAAGGTQCTVVGEPVRLWKSPSSESVETILQREGTRDPVFVDWPAKAASLDWPKQLPLIDGATYLVQVGKMAHSVRIRTLGASLTAGQMALQLGEAGCHRQLVLALTQLHPDRVISSTD